VNGNLASVEGSLGSGPAASARGSAHPALRRFLQQPATKPALLVLLLIVGAAVLAPWLAPYPADADIASHIDRRLLPPGNGFLLGTDHLGRDVFSRLLFGTRVSLLIGAEAMLASAVIGTVCGLAAGYRRGWLDQLLMRAADVFLGIPSLVLAILVSLSIGGGVESTVIAIAATSWPRYARLVRGEVLRTRVLEYVQAAAAYGASTGLIIRRHIFPSVVPVLIAQAALQVGTAILVAAGLGFIGLGARPPSPELGLAIAIGREYMPESWWISLSPGAVIVVLVVALNLLGDGLRAAFDPRAARQIG